MARLLSRTLSIEFNQIQLTRVVTGLCLIGYYLPFLPQWLQLFGPAGMVTSSPSLHSFWPLHFLLFHPVLFQLTSILFALSLISFTLGFKTNWSSFLLLLIHITFLNHNGYVHPSYLSLFNVLLIGFIGLRSSESSEPSSSPNSPNSEAMLLLKKVLIIYIGAYLLIVFIQRLSNPLWIQGQGFAQLNQWSWSDTSSNFWNSSFKSYLANFSILAFEGGFLILAFSSLNWVLLVLAVIYFQIMICNFDLYSYVLTLAPWLMLTVNNSPTELINRVRFSSLWNTKVSKENKEEKELREQVEKFRKKHEGWIGKDH